MRVLGGQPEEMEMGIDEPGQHGGALAVDDPRARTEARAHCGGRSERHHTAVREADRFGGWGPRVGADARVEEIESGRVQSDDGSGFASFSFISRSQQVSAPVPPLLQRTSTPHASQTYRFPSWLGMCDR